MDRVRQFNFVMFTLIWVVVLPLVWSDHHVGMDNGGHADGHECSSSPERGNCRNFTVNWFYNTSSRQCEQFWYGGCDGNGNNYKTQETCQSHCVSASRGTDNIVITEDDAKVKENDRKVAPSLSKCLQPSDRGRYCGQWNTKWYYNSDSGICDRFWYGGCDGNDNRFDDEQSCMRHCNEDVCKMSVVMGNCRDRLPRWYYDSSRRECRFFEYSGCSGNKNQFVTKDDCERRCLYGREALERSGCVGSRFGCCPDQVTPAQGNNNEGCPNACKATRYGCCDDDVTQAQGPNQEGCEMIEIMSGDGVPCGETDYGCCPDGETAATGPSNQGCDTRVVVTDRTDGDITVDVPAQCRLASDLGTCRDNMEVMWYYNTSTARCQMFWYGGCRGNQNRFKSEKECLTICRQVVKEPSSPEVRIPVCEQPKEIGPCRALIPRWAYNQNTGQCEEFNYGGCQGNQNNFEDRETCERYCRRGTPIRKAGECPRVVVDEESCSSTCNYDGDCPGDQKCCASPAGCRQCYAPAQTDNNISLTPEEVCAQPKVVGRCRASLPRYFYNPETRKCESFIYGGCDGNRNNFESLELCSRYCRPRIDLPRPTGRQNICELSPARGPCDRTITKYHYDIQTHTCRTFVYGGCLGNHNNFVTEAKCLSYCGLRTGNFEKEELCKQDYETGSCRGSFTRYYYDPRQGRCSVFNYGGCQGNGNNFEDEESCMNTCRGVRVSDRGQPRPRPSVRPTRPSVNRTESRIEDVCSLPLQTPCVATDEGPFWYYDRQTGVCREVPDGQCNNNRNSFRSREQCERYCDRARVCEPLYYTSEIRCLALIPSWTYNRQTGRCEQFNYGGCGGSANNFASEEACRRKCEERVIISTDAPEPEVTSPAEVCAMPADSGNCLASMRQWRYDMEKGECVQFEWGGCGGNKNNFDTKQACENYCSRTAVCERHEDPEVGCLAYIPRWRYDPTSNQCENFVYGGCGGNANNFETFEACEKKCIEVKEDTTRTDYNYNRVSTWRDICGMRYDIGPCRQSVTKWYYNSATASCQTFTYGGCLGNHNNFESEEQCLTYCRDAFTGYVAPTELPPDEIITGSGDITLDPVGVDVCHLPSETGVCRALINVWYYDHLVGECKRFVYGGCAGNANRFSSLDECQRQCNDREVCLLSRDSGMGYNYTTRYHFDYSAQGCRSFIYGGEDGNANNFETEEACQRKCDSLLRRVQVTKVGECPARTRNDGLLGACAPECRDDSQCRGNQKCCYSGCGYKCVDPVQEQTGPKAGYCPAKVDRRGLLGACAPQCQDDRDCTGTQKCCHHGCGMRCVNPVREEPYQMDVPVRVQANTMDDSTIHVTWYDPSLGREQLISDGRFYTIRYFSYDHGQYNYMNVTDLRGHINSLSSDTEYHFSVRANNPPYLSEWSGDVRSTTRTRAVNKAGLCPVLDPNTVGTCVNMCDSDRDCTGAQKCCSNGCGQTCVNPAGYDVCTLPLDRGQCSDWVVRWYYKVDENGKGMCDRFWFGGCEEQGNGNRFINLTDCEAACGTPATAPPRTARPYTCQRSMFGCCEDQYTPALDQDKSNCPENQRQNEEIVGATPGESVTLRCHTSRNGTWYRQGKLVESNDRRRVNNDGTLTVFAATIEDDGVYACHVYLDASRPYIYRYRLQVRIPIGILDGPDTIIVKPNHMAFLHCEAFGNPKPVVTWQKNGQPLQTGSSYQTFSNGTLLIRKATEEDIDRYTCTADNRVSQAVSRTIALNLREMLVARIENDNGRVTEGSRITLSCEGRGYPTPSITWEKMGQSIRTGGNVYISSSGRLEVREATLGDTGTYTCIVANSEEKIETSTSVQVIRKIVPDTEKCEDKTSLMKCRLIVTAQLCGYTMYSKICCNSCQSYYNGRQ